MCACVSPCVLAVPREFNATRYRCPLLARRWRERTWCGDFSLPDPGDACFHAVCTALGVVWRDSRAAVQILMALVPCVRESCLCV